MAWRVQALVFFDTRQWAPLERNRFENAVAICRQDGFETWEAAAFVSLRRFVVDTERRVDATNWSRTWIICSTLVLRRREVVSNRFQR